MRIRHRRSAIVFAILLGVCLIGLAITLNVGWIVLNWREILPLAVGIPVTLLLIAGVVLNTTFLIRELRHSDRQDSFLNAVTHELKTPIASIRLYLETLQRHPVPEEKRQEFYRIMLADSARLLTTVEQILKAGEISQGNRPRQLEAIDLCVLAREAAERAREANHLPPEAIRVESCGETLLINGSMEDLHTALGNLLGNSVKYSPNGIETVVRVYRGDAGWAVLSVEDHGIGIDAAHLKRVFKRFYRVPVRAVQRRQGTGLGLFLVKSIVRQHGGKIEAASSGENMGATFTVRLPLLEESAAARGDAR